MDHEQFEEKHPILAVMLDLVDFMIFILYAIYLDIKIMEKRRKIRFLGGFDVRQMKKEGYIFGKEGHIIGGKKDEHIRKFNRF